MAWACVTDERQQTGQKCPPVESNRENISRTTKQKMDGLYYIYITYKFITRLYISIRKRIWSAAMAPERLHIAGFKQFSFNTVFKCQKRIS